MRIAVLNSYGTDVTRGGAEVVVDLLATRYVTVEPLHHHDEAAVEPTH